MKRQKRATREVTCKRRRPRFSGHAEQRELESASEPYAPEVVKGTSRRVVVVYPDDETLFEQIIYVVRDEALAQPGVSAEEVLDQAKAIVQQKGKAAPFPPKQRCRLTAALLWLSGIALTLAFGICAYWYFYC